MFILSLEIASIAPDKAMYVAGNETGIYGGGAIDAFFADVGRNKRRVARRIKFHKERACSQRVPVKPGLALPSNGMDDKTVNRHAFIRFFDEMCYKLSFL